MKEITENDSRKVELPHWGIPLTEEEKKQAAESLEMAKREAKERMKGLQYGKG